VVDEKTVMRIDFSGAQTKNTNQAKLAVLIDNVLGLKAHQPLTPRLPKLVTGGEKMYRPIDRRDGAR